MKNLVLFCFIFGLFITSNHKYTTTSVVTLVGGVISSKHNNENTIKHKRKDCPICKGKGWYISGDGIKKIDCQYCEQDTVEDQTKIIFK